MTDSSPPLPSAIERRFPADLPTSGAWTPEAPDGKRQFVEVSGGRPFSLEGGGSLESVNIAFETWGELNGDASNAVLVCHALTGDSHASGSAGPGHDADGWWDDLIGPGKPLDTDRYFVVCSNVLGGCQGSTGPASVNPATGEPYGSSFPVVTVRDMVRAQAGVANALGIDAWLAVVGGSMGGMQVLEWGLIFPRRVRGLVAVATTAAASPLQIAWSAVGRLAIVNDPKFNGGDYYGAGPGGGPTAGLAIARQLAHVTYRTGEVFDQRFGRDLVDRREEFDQWGRYQVESYLDYQGQKLTRRFDANSYLVVNRAMDLHDVGRGRGGVAKALGRLTMPVLTASITSDQLYPPYQQAELEALINGAGGDCRYFVIDSAEGHDGFLLEMERLGPLIEDFITEIEKSG